MAETVDTAPGSRRLDRVVAGAMLVPWLWALLCVALWRQHVVDPAVALALQALLCAATAGVYARHASRLATEKEAAAGKIVQTLRQRNSTLEAQVAERTSHAEATLHTFQETVRSVARASGDILHSTHAHLRRYSDKTSAIEETLAITREVRQQAEEEARRAQQAGETITSTRAAGTRGLSSVQEASTAMQTVAGDVHRLATAIGELAQRLASIRKVTEVVDEVAEQTRLLALNAAIEAARAGEEGRVFSTVAREITALAEGSRASTVEVRRMLTDVEQVMGRVLSQAQGSRATATSAVARVETAGQTMQELVGTIDHTTAGMADILSATARQASSMVRIQTAMQQLQTLARQSLDDANRIEAAVQALSSLSSQGAAP